MCAVLFGDLVYVLPPFPALTPAALFFKALWQDLGLVDKH